MATPDKSPQDPTAAQAEPPKKKRGKLLLIVSVIFVLAGAGGGADWYFMRPADPNAAKAAEKPKPAIFLPLESFTVNLLPTESQPQFMQAGLTLQLDDSEAVDLIKARMPQIRDRLLMVLSSKRGPDLLSTAGKQKLAAEISEEVRKVIVPAMKPVAPAAKQVAAEIPQVGSAQAADAPAAAADNPPDAKSVDANLARQKVAIEVLFTSFIIQ